MTTKAQVVTDTQLSMKSENELSNAGDAADSQYTVRAVARVCSILNLLQKSAEGETLTEIAAEVELPVPTAFRYLSTLAQFDYVERDDETQEYRLGLAFANMQSRELQTFVQRALPYLSDLRSSTGETVNLGFLDGNNVIYLEILESPRSMRLAARQGDRDPIHSTALGKAIAAQLAESRVRRILDATGMTGHTERTITDADSYLAELARVREQRFALDNLENEADGRCVAVTIPGVRLPVAISVSAPASRFTMSLLDEFVCQLHQVADSITSALSHSS